MRTGAKSGLRRPFSETSEMARFAEPVSSKHRADWLVCVGVLKHVCKTPLMERLGEIISRVRRRPAVEL